MTDTTAPTGSPNLAAALSAFQGEMPKVPKNKTANVPTKSGGSYKYTYADLADVTEAAMPLLSKHGLSFTCVPDENERGFILRGVLMHSSGETLEGNLPLRGNGNQELGSALTYMRRYLLGAMTGIVTDDDEDGTVADTAERTKPAARQRKGGSTATPTATAPEPAEPVQADPAWADKIKDAATFDELTAVYNEADVTGVLGHMLGDDTLKACLYARRGELTSKDAQ